MKRINSQTMRHQYQAELIVRTTNQKHMLELFFLGLVEIESPLLGLFLPPVLSRIMLQQSPTLALSTVREAL